jgi:flagellar hook-associated protein 2
MAALTFSGIASGIDTEALIKSTRQQQEKLKIQPLQTRVQELTDTNDSLTQLSSLLGGLRSAASSFRTAYGGVLSKRLSSSNESAVTGVASNGATSGSYTLSVTSLAKNATASFSNRFGSADDLINGSLDSGAPASDRTLSVRIGQGSTQETVSLVIDNTTTLSQLATQFNGSTTKAQAVVINQGTTDNPSYALAITSTESGVDRGSLSFSAGQALNAAGTLSSTTISQATDAEFSVSGVSGSIKRSSNRVSDVIPGATFSLVGEGSATLTIANDTQKSAQSVSDFVAAFNKVVSYISEKDRVTISNTKSGPVAEFGPLAGTQLDEGILSSIRRSLTESSKLGNGTVNTLADLGISTQRDGTLSLDKAKLETALQSDPSSVEKVLQNTGDLLSATGGTIDQYTRFGGLLDAARNSNDRSIDTYSKRIQETESFLSKQDELMRAQFARLEAVIGSLQQQQSTLSNLFK